MKLAQDKLVLDPEERALLALGCGNSAQPAHTVEAMTAWLAATASDEVGALIHGARRCLFNALCVAIAQPSPADRSCRIWCVIRHPGALGWLYGMGIRPQRVVPHLVAAEVGVADTVIGVLPPLLSAELNARGVRCLQIMLALEPQDRGQELDAARMRALGAYLAEVQVCCRPLAVSEWGAFGAA